jgi:hypothetical protein
LQTCTVPRMPETITKIGNVIISLSQKIVRTLTIHILYSGCRSLARLCEIWTLAA